MIYLDNSATTRPDESVVEAMLPWLRDNFGNASSVYELGRKARIAVEGAREEIAHIINAHPAELTFTSGGTESNNTILKSCCAESGLTDTIVYSAIEHHAVSHPAEELQRQGFTIHELSVSLSGRIVPEEVAQYNQPRTLISIMHANNETGVVQPIETLRGLAPDVYIHTDAVQSFGKIPFDVQALAIDFASFSSHKLHGPKGIGAMFIRKGISFKAHQQGGSQERNRRGGTEPVALIVGFQTATRNAYRELEQRTAIMCARTALLRELLVATIPDIRFNTPEEFCLPNIINVSFTDAGQIDGEAILQSMDIRGIAVSHASACASGAVMPSHVLLAMGRPWGEAKAALRFSVSKDTTEEEIRTAVQTLSEVMQDLRENCKVA